MGEREMTNEELALRIVAIEETLADAGIVIRSKDSASTALPELAIDSSKAVWSFIPSQGQYKVTVFPTCRSCDYEFEFGFQAKPTDKDGMERIAQCPRCEKRFRCRVWHRQPKEQSL
jgi:hypothetical protein